MFRTIIVNVAEKIRISDNWVVIIGGEKINRIPLSDIYSIVIDNPNTNLSLTVINALTSNGAHIILCDDKHMPSSLIMPNSIYYRPLSRLLFQINMEENFKHEMWRKIVSTKIKNQANLVEYIADNSYVASRIMELANTIVGDDDNNCEGVAAKLFFRALYGTEFMRTDDDIINAALNYGYSIIRSSVTKGLICHGFNCTLGIHHKNIYNAFNLADDLMEPFRPVVDCWVLKNLENLTGELTKENRRELVDIINRRIKVNGTNQALRNAIENYIVSFAKSMEQEEISILCVPEIKLEDDK